VFICVGAETAKLSELECRDLGSLSANIARMLPPLFQESPQFHCNGYPRVVGRTIPHRNSACINARPAPDGAASGSRKSLLPSAELIVERGLAPKSSSEHCAEPFQPWASCESENYT
jgi:hypothetical protein